MTATILAGLNIIPGIGIIGPGAGISGASIGDVNTGLANITGTGGIVGTTTTNSISHWPVKR
jgi:hypothetical protein